MPKINAQGQVSDASTEPPPARKVDPPLDSVPEPETPEDEGGDGSSPGQNSSASTSKTPSTRGKSAKPR